MGSLIYIAAIVLIAIISNVNKAAKNKKAPGKGGGMPTFGGGGEDHPLRRPRPSNPDAEAQRSGSGFPMPVDGVPGSARSEAFPEQHEHELAPAWQESPLQPGPDYETGEGMSAEQSSYREDSVELRTAQMQRELERLEASFDGMSGFQQTEGTRDAGGAGGRGDEAVASRRSSLTSSSNALQNGLIWSEILGPPRSRRPHSTRR